MSTKVTFLSQASVVIDAGDIRIATDPWFDRPACVRATVPWPPFTPEERASVTKALEACSHIYVSHDHEDHFDPWLLGRLSRKTLIVGAFHNLRFRDELSELAGRHTIVYLEDGEELQLSASVRVKMLLEKPLYRVNSILMVRTADGLILNGNDCGIDTAMIEAMRAWRRPAEPMLFLYTLNLLASGWFFPYCRAGDPATLPRYLKVKEDVVQNWQRLIREIGPTFSATYAGPLVMVDPVNGHLNDYPHARDNAELIRRIGEAEEVMWPAPFSVIEMEGAKHSMSRPDWSAYADRPLVPQGFAPDADFAADVPAGTLLEEARRFHQEVVGLQAELGLSVRPALVFSIADGFQAMEDWPLRRLLVDVRSADGAVRELGADEEVPEPWFGVSSTGEMVLQLLRNQIPWDSFYGGRARLARRPDTFDQSLHLILHFGRDPLGREALKAWLKQRQDDRRREETMIRIVDGRECRFLRYCPHEGEDLANAEVRDGKLVCPRHRWEFDVATGRCLRGDLRTSIRPGHAVVEPAPADHE